MFIFALNMIKNLIFDFGGVFCTADLDSCVAAFKALGFSDIENYLNRYAQKGKFGDLEAGKITDGEFLEYVRSHTGREVTYEECRNAWLSFIAGICGDNLAQITELKAKGYRVALLSNTNAFVASWIRHDILGVGLDSYIDREHQYLSFEMKCMKPAAGIFEKLLECEGFVPGETLFIDDSEVNLESARDLGIRTFLVSGGENWGERLGNYLSSKNE